jgi:hypothetical protein
VRDFPVLPSKHLVGNDLRVVPAGVLRRPRGAITIRFGSEYRVPGLGWPDLERCLFLALLGLGGRAVVILLVIVVAIVIHLCIHLLIQVDEILRAPLAALGSLFFGAAVRIPIIVIKKVTRLVLLAAPLDKADLVHDLAPHGVNLAAGEQRFILGFAPEEIRTGRGVVVQLLLFVIQRGLPGKHGVLVPPLD